MESLVYNIPTSLAGAYRGRHLIVRHHDPAEIVRSLSNEDLERVAYVQVLSLGSDPGPLLEWSHEVPVDLVVQDIENDLPLLYRYTSLLNRRPVRVTVPVTAGFGKVVKLALALNFAVKLDVSQPGRDLIREMDRIVGAYLHQSTVSQPVEYFHSLLLAYYRREPLSLWSIQEEDPSQFLIVAENGTELLPGRLAGHELSGDLMAFPRDLRAGLAAGGGECSRCDFLAECCGYFKWPDRDYSCEGVKALFGTLRTAAEQLREDLVSYSGEGRESSP
jgi:hypothetical protein